MIVNDTYLVRLLTEVEKREKTNTPPFSPEVRKTILSHLHRELMTRSPSSTLDDLKRSRDDIPPCLPPLKKRKINMTRRTLFRSHTTLHTPTPFVASNTFNALEQKSSSNTGYNALADRIAGIEKRECHIEELITETQYKLDKIVSLLALKRRREQRNTTTVKEDINDEQTPPIEETSTIEIVDKE
eukprot:TRINITY_DN7269_c0_g1_i1.p1 TRINITY_DN7269_c0_g1~~TRINITY_DN7269_c0_g1_i1.p1  ORF type:complete len:186 (-),score=41.63 TRINITY_DN7269_c0_g1_i1:9-566(-)